MKESVTSWIVTVCSVIAAAIAVASKLVIDPLVSVIASGVIVIATGCIVLIGHAAGVDELYIWTKKPPGMAIETAIMFILIGSGKITMAVNIRRLKSAHKK